MSESSNQGCCVVCLNSQKTHACVPCGHKCVCEKCAFIIMNTHGITKKKCPICRKGVSCIIRIYDDTEVEEKKEEFRYIPIQYVGYEEPWKSVNIKDCKACKRSKNGICYTHLYVSGAPVE